MAITSVNKTVNVEDLLCGGEAQVTLSVTATPSMTENPVDIVLTLDRSGSMAGTALTNLKAAATTFVETIAKSTGSADGSEILGGSRIGIVSFAASATIDTQLITNTAQLDAAINALVANGNTNQADAFGKANSLFDDTTKHRIVVMVTDGKPTVGPDPTPIAEALRAVGVEIYCIGLMGAGGIDEALLKEWASTPVEDHVLIAPTNDDIEQAFSDLIQEIVTPGATNVSIYEEVESAFTITAIGTPSVGEIDADTDSDFFWNIETLAASEEETATLTFTIRHNGFTQGTLDVNRTITLTDDEQQVVAWPNPQVFVDCGTPTVEPICPAPIDITLEGCDDTAHFDLGEIYSDCVGRILTLDLTLRNVCPGKRMAVAIVITEFVGNTEVSRGFKTMIVQGPTATECGDVFLECVSFVLPEDPDERGCERGLCRTRNMRVRVLSNMIDSTFNCCGAFEIT